MPKLKITAIGDEPVRRQCLPDLIQRVSMNPGRFNAFGLARRKGVELGFADSRCHASAPKLRWGHGELLLTQAYFYSGFDDIQAYGSELPHGLTFIDSRDDARAKLAAFEASRRSYLTDTWDTDGYRLNVTYRDGHRGIDRIACRQLATPLPHRQELVWPELCAITAVFGSQIDEPDFLALWDRELDADAIQLAQEEDELDLTQNYGATIALAGGMFRAITFHANRDTESVGWGGPLPCGLCFEDSPEQLLAKITQPSAQQSDSALTGHRVWCFPEFTLHVLYSNTDNRLLRITLIAPGTWRA